MTRTLAPALASLLALLLVVATHSGAQDRPCADDARKYCPEVTPGKGAIFNCLKPHKGQLSEACQKQLEHVESREKEANDRRQKARQQRGTLRVPPAAATPAAPAPQPTKS